jgi:hypothetical protein
MGLEAAASLYQQKRKRLLDVDGSKAPDKRIWRPVSKETTSSTQSPTKTTDTRNFFMM